MNAPETSITLSELKLRTLLDTIVDGIITINSKGIIENVNPATEKMFQYTQEELIGQSVNVLIPEPYASKHDGYIQRYLKTGEKKIIGIGREVTGKRKDGSIFPMDLAVSEMKINNESLFTGILRDITERKKLERLKTAFISTVSHELRTPLTSIRGALGLVLARSASILPDKIKTLLETANRNSEQLSLLINDILDLEKIGSGSMNFDIKPLDLALLTKQAALANEGYAVHHGVNIKISDCLPKAMVKADETRIMQVFSNLISNAIKYSEKNQSIELSLTEQSDHHFKVTVKDHGRGIPANFREKIFEPFSQADSSDIREKRGTGLGLSISKTIIEHHGGLLDYSSEEGVGTEFFFVLPKWDRVFDVVYVDDDEDIRTIIQFSLENEADLKLTLFDSGQALLDRLSNPEGFKADLILLDVMMPKLDGPGTLARLKTISSVSTIPIAFMTAKTQPSEIESLLHQGAIGVIAKPFDPMTLASQIRNLLS